MLAHRLIDIVTVAGYAGVAAACWFVPGKRAAPDAAARDRFWTVAAVVLAALALSRLFGVAEALTSLGREVAAADGWYASRRPLQKGFVYGLAATALLLFIGLAWRSRPMPPGRFTVLAGVLFLACYAVVRATSAHRIDVLLARAPVPGVTWESIVELSGIALVAAGLVAQGLASRRTRAGAGR